MTKLSLEDVAAFYNKRARRDPSNPPTRAEVAEHFGGVSKATAQRWLELLDERRKLGAEPCLCYPLRRRGREERW